MFQKGILHRWILGKGVGSTRDTECLVWGSGSLLSMASSPGVSQKAVSVPGVSIMCLSAGPEGHPADGRLAFSKQRLSFCLCSFMELQPVSPCLQELGTPQSYPSDKVGIDLEPS